MLMRKKGVNKYSMAILGIVDLIKVFNYAGFNTSQVNTWEKHVCGIS